MDGRPYEGLRPTYSGPRADPTGPVRMDGRPYEGLRRVIEFHTVPGLTVRMDGRPYEGLRRCTATHFHFGTQSEWTADPMRD